MNLNHRRENFPRRLWFELEVCHVGLGFLDRRTTSSVFLQTLLLVSA